MTCNKTKNKATGNLGEDLAAEHLNKTGYKILERNLRLSFGEIDILAEDKKTIVVVEVKTVRGFDFGPAQELVRFKKQQKLRLLGRAISQKFPDKNIRIDVVAVDLSNGLPAKIEHIQNAVC